MEIRIEKIVGRLFTARFADGSERSIAAFSQSRADLFYGITALLQDKVLHQPSGVSPDNGTDEHWVDPDTFVRFFERFWREGWLSDSDNSFVSGWAPWAAGMVENITLMPLTCRDRSGKLLKVRRYRLEEKSLEALLAERKREGISTTLLPDDNITDVST